jgi:hypothetical protein
MYDNKVRLSQDILEKAEAIASAWGLKNSRAAIEAVFRKYADDYLYGRLRVAEASPAPVADRDSRSVPCEALDELDRLLGV